MGCIRTVEVQVPDRVQTVTVPVPNRISVVEVQVPGLPGPPGPGSAQAESIQRNFVSDSVISGHRVVRATSEGTIDLASADDLSHADAIVGINTQAANSGAQSNVVLYGMVTESSWSWTPMQNVFVGINGLITQVAPATPTSLYLRVIGVAVSPDTIFVNLGPVTELI